MLLKPVASDGVDAGFRQQETLRAEGQHWPYCGVGSLLSHPTGRDGSEDGVF